MSALPDRCDLLVIGGGPAGATLAAIAARRGADVIVLERDAFPRDKVCGEFLSWDSFPILERIGVLQKIEALGPARISRCRLVTPVRTSEVGLPEVALGISRAALDEVLIRHASEAGAGVFERSAIDSIERFGDGHRVSLHHADGESTSLVARVVVGAWGRWGRLDLALKRSFATDRRQRYIGFKRHYAAGLTEADVIELHPFRRGYLGAQAVEGGRSNLCGLVHQEEIAGMRGGWDSFASTLVSSSDSLARLLGGAAALGESFLSSEPVIFRAKEPVHEGMLLTGDSAGLIDPLTGNGMAMAIQSAALAAPFALSMLAGADRDEALAGYARTHHAFFRRRIAWSRAAASALRRPRLVTAGVAAGIAAPLLSLFTVRTRAAAAEARMLASSV